MLKLWRYWPRKIPSSHLTRALGILPNADYVIVKFHLVAVLWALLSLIVVYKRLWVRSHDNSHPIAAVFVSSRNVPAQKTAAHIRDLKQREKKKVRYLLGRNVAWETRTTGRETGDYLDNTNVNYISSAREMISWNDQLKWSLVISYYNVILRITLTHKYQNNSWRPWCGKIQFIFAK